MKKFISFAAFALLASALTFSLTACSSDDDEGDDLPDVPQTAEQAKAMLMGQWQVNNIESYSDELLIELNADGHYYVIRKIKNNLPENRNKEWYYPYRGKYVGFILFDEYLVYPTEDDPTQGGFHTRNKSASGGFTTRYENLTKSSFKLQMNTDPYTRRAKPVSYEKIPRPIF